LLRKELENGHTEPVHITLECCVINDTFNELCEIGSVV
jgi:hypothetical protein